MNEKRLYSAWVLMILAVEPAFGSAVARSVSPGGEGEATIAFACPTFSWGASAAAGFEIAVYRLREDGALADGPALLQAVPAGARSWTPAADRCLAPGHYAWTLRETAGNQVTQWSRPRFFRVEADAPKDLEAMIEAVVERTVERWLAEGARPRATRVEAELGPGSRTESTGEGALVDRIGGPNTSRPSFVADTTLYDPPDCTPSEELFTDVPASDSRCEFIEQFAADEISTGCTPGPNGRFCPDDPVTRGQLAVYLERAMRGTSTWNVNADLLDGLDSTAFVPAAGGTLTGGLNMGNNLVVNIGGAGTDFLPGGGLAVAGNLLLGGTFSMDGGGNTITAGELNVLNGGLRTPVVFTGHYAGQASTSGGNAGVFFQYNPSTLESILLERLSCFAQTPAMGGTGSATIQFSDDGGTTGVSCVLGDGAYSCSASLSGITFTSAETMQLDVVASAATPPSDITCTVEGEVQY